MLLLDGRPLLVDDGILVEPAADGRVVLWLLGEREDGSRRWDRVGIAPGASVIVRQGISSLAAVSTPTRRQTGSRFGMHLRRLTGASGEPVWTLPGGGRVERCGPRRTDLVFAWSEDPALGLDVAKIMARWSGCRDVRRIGPELHLVSGVESAQPEPKSASAAELAPPVAARHLAEQALDEARRSGERRREVTALIDLGVVHLNQRDARAAMPILEEALAGARQLGDRARIVDSAVNLAQAVLVLGRPAQAVAILGPALGDARDIADRYAEKLALERLGFAYQALADHPLALDYFEQALAIARELGDFQHEAALLWQAAIEYAELGRPDRALARGDEAVARLQWLKKPESDNYARRLSDYRSILLTTPAVAAGFAAGHGHLFGESVITAAPHSLTTQASPASGPGLLRMALTATKAAVTFAGTGFRTVTAHTYQARLAACSGCEQHTGVRCRVCGCITAAKARLPHEDCPAGKWPPENGLNPEHASRSLPRT